MKYCRWTTRDLGSLMLGEMLSSVCTEERHERCMEINRGCSSVLKGARTIHDKGEREKAAREALARCRKVKIVIEEVEAG